MSTKSPTVEYIQCESCNIVSERVDDLERTIEEVSHDKDRRINDMHGDLLGVRAEVRKLTEGLQATNVALTVIAENTTVMAKMAEMVQVYENLKGFAWVMKHLGYLAVLAIGAMGGAWVAFRTYGG